MNDQPENENSNAALTAFASHIALEQLRSLAGRLDAQLFTLLLRPIFGTDLAPALFIKLQQALVGDTLRTPSYQLKDQMRTPCSYDAQTGVFEVSRQAIEQAIKQPEHTASLMISLIGALALYLHEQLRSAQPSTEAAPANLAAAFTQALLFYTEPIASGRAFATYTQSGTEQVLVLAMPAPGHSIKKRFAAGRGEERSPTSFGHESIEDALRSVGFDDDQRKAIYFGNWLRDYSQLIDAKIVHPVKDATADSAEIIQSILQGNVPRISRQKLTAIVDLFALRVFHTLQATPEQREGYRVTPGLLGVYRPHEHIDNPTTLDRQAFDPRSIDPEFTALVFPEDIRNALMPKRSMKRYIRRPIAYLHNKLKAAKRAGMTPTGMRYFGEALHVLEDFFAHTNFVELSLRKMGHGDVLPWTTRIESREQSRHEWPVVSGMFGALDIVASVTNPLAELLYPTGAPQQPEPGERNDFDHVMLILLEDEQAPLLLKGYELYLEARDKVRGNEIYQWFNRATSLIELPAKTIEYATNLIKKPLLKWAGDHIATLQVHLDKDPNTDPSAAVTHSQLAKDHDSHPFHTLAVALASEAVRVTGQAMYDHWTGKGSKDNDPQRLAEGFIVHPNDSEWFTQIVQDWAQLNPEKIEQGKSIETLRHFQQEELEQALETVKRALDDAQQHVDEIEELTGTSFWTIAERPDAGPAPWI